MECICVICEDKPSADALKDLSAYTTILYNLTSFEISEWDETRLLKICDVCKEKLLQYDNFRTLCLKMCLKLKQRLKTPDNLPLVSMAFVKLEDNSGDKHCSDSELLNESKFDLECKLENLTVKSPAIEQRITKNCASAHEECEDFSNNRNDTSEQDKKEIKTALLECHLCGKSFRNPNNLEGHIRAHQGLKPALCKLCGKAFIRWHSLKLHMIQKHTERRGNEAKTTFPCDFDGCKASFATKQGMSRHRKSHDPEYTKPMANTFVCELCGKTFSSKGSLQKHSYIHTGNMPFHCTVCDKRYPTAHKLKEHTMRHQGIKNHTCPHCGLKKTTMHELRVHMNYHTKERTYPCNFCKKVFMNTGNLATHVKTVHQRQTPFNCTECSRSFGKKESLKRHTMTHTGERPHECKACGKRFIQFVALQSHSKVHSK